MLPAAMDKPGPVSAAPVTLDSRLTEFRARCARFKSRLAARSEALANAGPPPTRPEMIALLKECSELSVYAEELCTALSQRAERAEARANQP